MRLARTLGRWIVRLVLVASVMLLVALGVGPRTGIYRTVTVLTGSMRPGIPAGAVVVVTPEPAADVRAGQIITYEAPLPDRRIVTHRVVEVVEAGPQPVVRTKGDANSDPDPWLARITSPMVWRVRMVVPGLGHAIRALRTPAAHRATVFFVPALLALVWLRDIWRRRPDEPPASAQPAATGGSHA